MSPRAYNLGLRLAAAEQTRARIISAAREILSDDEFDGLSIDAIARRAGVARMTVYYQFTSRKGLLEALYNDLAARGFADNLPAVQQAPDPVTALDILIDAFTRFWANDRLIIRRLRGITVIDPEIEAGIRERDGRRRFHVAAVLERLEAEQGWHSVLPIHQAGDVIATLIGFESYDALAPAEATPDDTINLIQRAVHVVLGLQEVGR